MTTICYPAIPAVPGVDATFNTSANLGWNAGAASIRALSGDAVAEFSFGVGNVGSLAGFAPAGSPSGAFNAVSHGLLYSGDTIVVVEGGVTTVDSGVIPTSSTRVSISRSGGVVRYKVGGWTHTSTLVSRGDIQLYAALYAAGDYIDNPTFVGAQSLAADSAWGWSDDVTRRSLRARSAWGWGATISINDGVVNTTIGLDVLASDYAVGALSGEVADVVLSAQAGFSSVEASGISFVMDMAGSAVASSIIGGDVLDELPLYAIGAEDEYGDCAGEVADIDVLAVDTGEAPGTGSYTEGLYLRDRYAADPVVYALLADNLSVGDLIEVLIALDASLLDTLVVLDETDATSVLYALISAGITVSDDAGVNKAALLQYATNVITGAVARYSGFGFKGFCSVGMETFGWKSDGLYKIGADTDDGEFIAATIDFAADDFDTAQRKRMDAVFFGISTDGQMFAKVTDDHGVSTTYRVMERGSEARANVRRGDSSRYWRLQLQVVDATYVELDNIEWVVGATGRRTTR